MSYRNLSQDHYSVRSIILMMFGILIVLAICGSIPLPGLEQGLVDETMARGGSSRISIMALGIQPLLTIFALGQVLILLAPKLEGRRVFVLSLLVLIFISALSQAYGISQALLATGQGGEDSVIRSMLITVTLVGGVAVTLFLGGLLRLPLLTSGFWLILLTGTLSSMPLFVMRTFEMLRMGAIPLSEPLIAIGCSIAGIFLSMLAVRLLLKGVMIQPDHGTGAPTCRNLLGIVVWPPFLAMMFARQLTPLTSLDAFSFLLSNIIHPISWFITFQTIWTVILIPVFVWLYWRYFDRRGCSLSPFTTVFLAGAQILVVAGEIVVSENMTFPTVLSGTAMLIIAAIWFAVLDVANPKRA
ncbi:hypothetical protein [uncultured Agrobacterium sp.]|uniref:hypothetical protein n=1 Tax=uncultured Agrobacterium sp. TaxID=157277 RepID=UPI002585F8FB|nr:hypothetical protein [uncultured Agrobacterium sp.]